jgi:hypothetical protein
MGRKEKDLFFVANMVVGHKNMPRLKHLILHFNRDGPPNVHGFRDLTVFLTNAHGT